MVASKYMMGVGMVVIAVVAFFVGLFAAPLVFPPSAVADPVWDRVSKSGTIIVGTEPGWPPYEYMNLTTQQIIGFEIDLMNMIAANLSLTVEWRDTDFNSIIPAIESRELDVGVSGFSVTPERLDRVQFTMYHSITEGQVIMLQNRRDFLGITQLTSLKNLTDYGLKCGVQISTIQETELSELAPDALTTYQDFLLALQAMKNGQIDCVYAETPITSNWILEAEQASEEPIVVVFSRPYYPVAFVANKDADTLVAKIDGALAEIIASGQLDELRQKWKT